MRRLLIVLALLLVSWPVQSGAAPIYVFRQKDGTVRFSTSAPPQGVQTEVFTGHGRKFSLYSGRGFRNFRVHRDKYRDLINMAAQAHRLEPSLLQAVIHCESGFNPGAVSPKGAMGLMQLMPDRARLLGVRDPFSPNENVNGGARHLAFLIRKFGGNLRFALAAYNAGEQAVEKYGGIPPYQETREYVRRVLEVRERYAVRRAEAKIGPSIGRG